MKSASISWKNDTLPLSDQFDDIYFDIADGLNESRYVFLEGIGAPDSWAGKSDFAICETGFGTGLNFLTTWQAWRAIDGDKPRLHFFSIEGYPLSKENLAKALANFPELAELSQELIASYPPIHPGFHHTSFDNGRVHLTLMFGEAAAVLSQLNGTIDGWYLDGFAPAKNPEMWRMEVLEHIARLSRNGARFATFTAASEVRRNLQSLGFTVEKTKGFGRKAERLIGCFEAESNPERFEEPWFRRQTPKTAIKSVAVIGAGAAGCATAAILHGAGFDVTIVEQNDRCATEGSGNPIGVVAPRLAMEETLDGRFHSSAFMHAIRFYDQLERAGFSVWKGERGILTVAKDDEELLRNEELIKSGSLPDEFAMIVTREEASEIAGIETKRGGLFFPKTGCASPAELCPGLVQGLKIFFHAQAIDLEQSDKGWRIKTRDGSTLVEADAVILANAVDAGRLAGFSHDPLKAFRGQISIIAKTEESQKLRVGMTYGGYMTPALADVNGTPAHIVGATYAAWTDLTDRSWSVLSDADDAENIDKLDVQFPAIAPTLREKAKTGKGGLRCVTPDHLPMVGPVYDEAAYMEVFAKVRHGVQPKRLGPVEPVYKNNLFMASGLGSRALQTAPLIGELICAYLSGAPLPVPNDIAQALHPARFLIRALKRNQI